MSDLALDTNGDLFFDEGGSYAEVSSDEQTKQQVYVLVQNLIRSQQPIGTDAASQRDLADLLEVAIEQATDADAPVTVTPRPPKQNEQLRFEIDTVTIQTVVTR